MLRVALCQVNLTVGDLDGNVEVMARALKEAEAADAHVACFPELGAAGYPPEDLVLKRGFVHANRSAVDRFAAARGRDRAPSSASSRTTATCSTTRPRSAPTARSSASTASSTCPTTRCSTSSATSSRAPSCPCSRSPASRSAVSICEDAWQDGGPDPRARRRRRPGHPQHQRLALLRGQGPGAGAPHRDPGRRRADCPIVYLNLVGGQDELVFDGDSFVCDADGEVVARAEAFVEQVLVVDVEPGPARPVTLARGAGDRRGHAHRAPLPVAAGRRRDLSHEAEVWEAVVLGTRDYVTKNGFGGVVLGLSGGVDSSLVAAIAVDALGADKVHGVLMPSRYSSDHSVTDAERLAAALGIDHRTIAIEAAHTGMLDDAGPVLRGPGAGPHRGEPAVPHPGHGAHVAEQQVRLAGADHRPTRARARSATPRSSATPPAASPSSRTCPSCWSTTCAGYRNGVAGRELIPEAVLTKPPSAELRPDQRDDQSLPPYPVLDPILELYVEDDRSDRRDRRRRPRPRPPCERIVAPGRRGRVQAPPHPARPQADHQGLRPGPPPPHHQPLSR